MVFSIKKILWGPANQTAAIVSHASRRFGVFTHGAIAITLWKAGQQHVAEEGKKGETFSELSFKVLAKLSFSAFVSSSVINSHWF